MDNQSLSQQFPQLEDALKKIVQGKQWNVLSVGKEFTVVRYDLDVSVDHQTVNFEENKFRLPFKSFWVQDVSDLSVIAEIKVNSKGDQGDGLPVRKNLTIGFDYAVAGATFKWNSQPGKWFVVIYAHNTEIRPGFVDIQFNGKISLTDGSGYAQNSFEVSSTPSVIFAASTTRVVGTIQNNSGVTIYVGNAANVAHVDFKKKCTRIFGNSGLFQWRNAAALSWRTEEVGPYDEISVTEES